MTLSCTDKKPKKIEYGTVYISRAFYKYPVKYLVPQLDFNIHQLDQSGNKVKKVVGDKNDYYMLTTGSYIADYKTIYNTKNTLDFKILANDTLYLDLYLDVLNYSKKETGLFYDLLEEGESLSITMKSKGCFHFNTKKLTLNNKNNIHFATYEDRTIPLTVQQMQLIKEFEIELRNIHGDYCTTTDNYHLFLNNQNLYFKTAYSGCVWNGFDHLVDQLGLEK